ncbi:MAG: hypothetical protein BWY63_02971 [Chloroflexi bacterium ADurb.Bin360]|nr:MAG: hypothetical protein BWY63_02971 [Chloroflexi bacterium ADurb.Bin360]
MTAKTVPEIVASGRSRWKVENEGFNVLKNQGYNFEHNFGHGQQQLSSVLLTLLLLAFLCHTVLALTCSTYQAIRRELGTRRTFFNDLQESRATSTSPIGKAYSCSCISNWTCRHQLPWIKAQLTC